MLGDMTGKPSVIFSWGRREGGYEYTCINFMLSWYIDLTAVESELQLYNFILYIVLLKKGQKNTSKEY